MCDCKKEVEAKLLDHFVKGIPAGAGHKVELQGYGIVMGGGTMSLRAFMPYETTVQMPTKAGCMRQKKTKGNMFFSFCPFCGEKVGAADKPQECGK